MHHFSPEMCLPAMRLYHERFRPSAARARPAALLTVAAICAPPAEEARRLAAPSSSRGWVRLRAGQPAPLASPEEALAYPYTPHERALAEQARQLAFVGTPGDVRDGILALADRTGATEVMVTTMVHGHAERRRSYVLLAGAFGLAG